MMKTRILAVDDFQVSKGLVDLWEMMGCEAYAVDNEADAWRLFEEKRPDACVLDLVIPRSPFDGMTLLRKMRIADKNMRCYVFTGTYCPRKSYEEQSRQIGIQGFYEKGLSGEKYMNFIREVAGIEKKNGDR